VNERRSESEMRVMRVVMGLAPEIFVVCLYYRAHHILCLKTLENQHFMKVLEKSEKKCEIY
jgi:hypothetical protein